MDKKSLEKMIRNIMSGLKSEDPDSDSDPDDPKPSTSSGRGLLKKSLKRLQKSLKKKANKLGFEQVEERRKLFAKNKLENVGFTKNFRCLPKVCRDVNVQKPSCVDQLVKAGLWGREVIF